MNIYKNQLSTHKTEQSFERVPSVRYIPGQLAVHVAAQEVGFMKTSLKVWAKAYQAEIPEDAIVTDVNKTASAEASSDAYVFEADLVQEALRHRFEISQTADRTAAGQLLAQLAVADTARQEYLDKVETHGDLGELLASRTINLPEHS